MNLWWEGARVRTLPAAVAPVLIGAASAGYLGSFSLTRSVMAFLVAVFLQIGVNFSNDYSDGIRGTDDHRVGPARLTASGLVAPRLVLYVALGFFAAAGLVGLALVAISGTWWLIVAGLLAVIAAWFYTGGRNPYGYMGVGLSEILVFVFFGLMATVGTTYVQTLDVPWWVWVLASGVGAISVALLMVNNTRDIATDAEAGKRTLVVRLGDKASRVVYVLLLVIALGCFIAVMASFSFAWVYFLILILVAVNLGKRMLVVCTREDFLALLRDTGLYAVIYAFCVSASLLM